MSICAESRSEPKSAFNMFCFSRNFPAAPDLFDTSAHTYVVNAPNVVKLKRLTYGFRTILMQILLTQLSRGIHLKDKSAKAWEGSSARLTLDVPKSSSSSSSLSSVKTFPPPLPTER